MESSMFFQRNVHCLRQQSCAAGVSSAPGEKAMMSLKEYSVVLGRHFFTLYIFLLRFDSDLTSCLST